MHAPLLQLFILLTSWFVGCLFTTLRADCKQESLCCKLQRMFLTLWTSGYPMCLNQKMLHTECHILSSNSGTWESYIVRVAKKNYLWVSMQKTNSSLSHESRSVVLHFQSSLSQVCRGAPVAQLVERVPHVLGLLVLCSLLVRLPPVAHLLRVVPSLSLCPPSCHIFSCPIRVKAKSPKNNL